MPELIQHHFEQGSDDWLEWRKTVSTASVAAGVVGAGVFKGSRTPLELWKVLTGRDEVIVTPAMMRGNEHEPGARAIAEQRNGVVLSPGCFQRGRYGASLDAIDIDRTINVEIKVPGRGIDSQTWQETLDKGIPPDAYIWQLVHQYHVVPTERVVFCLFDPLTELHYQLDVDTELLKSKWPELEKGWERLQHHLANDTPPDPVEGIDRITREDSDWYRAAEDLRHAQIAVSTADSLLEDAKQVIRDLSHRLPTTGNGVTISWFRNLDGAPRSRITINQAHQSTQPPMNDESEANITIGDYDNVIRTQRK